MSIETPSETELSKADPKADLWVFGYGSLMWRPGFEFLEQVPARLIGEHRALCVYSSTIAGRRKSPASCSASTAAAPAAASPSGSRRRDAATPSTICASREQTTHVYREVMRSVWLENETRQRVSALAYVVDRGHVQYAGRLSLTEQLRYVQQGHGRSGNNRDYVLSTVKSIEAQGFRDPQLHQLALMLHDDTPLHR